MSRADEQKVSIRISARGPDGQEQPKSQQLAGFQLPSQAPRIAMAATPSAKLAAGKPVVTSDAPIRVTVSQSNSPLPRESTPLVGDATPNKHPRSTTSPTTSKSREKAIPPNAARVSLPPHSTAPSNAKGASSSKSRGGASGLPSSSFTVESGFYLDLPGGVRSAPGYSQNHVLPQLAQYIPPYYEYTRPPLTETPAGVVPLAASDDQWGPLENISASTNRGAANPPRMQAVTFAPNGVNAKSPTFNVGSNHGGMSVPIPQQGPGVGHEPHASELAPFYPMLLPTPTMTTETAHMSTNLYFPLPPPAIPTRNVGNRPGVHISEFFVSENLRNELSRRQAANLAIPFKHDVPIPESMFCYHSLVPLEPLPALQSHSLLGFKSLWYRCTSQRDGRTYALLRILDFRLPHESMLSSVVDSWSGIQHPGVIRMHEAFTTSAFGADLCPSLVLVFDFYPGSRTLAEFLSSKALRSDNPDHLRLVMAMLMQLSSAINAVHRAGLALGANIDETKILITSRNRLRFNGCGAQDFVGYSLDSTAASRLHREATPEQLQADFDRLGSLFARITGSNGMQAPAANLSPHSASSALAASVSKIRIAGPPGLSQKGSPPSGGISISRRFTTRGWPESLQRAFAYLNDSTQHRSVEQLIGICPDMALAEMDEVHSTTDAMEDELCRSLENGRLARLLMKINFVTDRPEHAMDPRWAQTGDRYFVRLFKEYVFHTVDQSGNPIIDVGHVVTCLNKLDAGVTERIPLTSNDGRNVLIVGYDELHRCIESSFNELLNDSNAP